MKPPQDKAAVRPQEPGRRPEYVIVTWVSEQLRDRIQRNGASLAGILQAIERNAGGLADPGQKTVRQGSSPPPGNSRPGRPAPGG